MADPTPPRKPLRPCPICHKTATERDRPFCSPRCAEIDLGRWFGETYRIAGPPQEAAANDTDDEMTG